MTSIPRVTIATDEQVHYRASTEIETACGLGLLYAGPFTPTDRPVDCEHCIRVVEPQEAA